MRRERKEEKKEKRESLREMKLRFLKIEEKKVCTLFNSNDR